MATHDYVLANQSGSSFRTDLNNALAAVVSNNSNATEPSTKYSYQTWADTNSGYLKIRNAANNSWVSLFKLDGTDICRLTGSTNNTICTVTGANAIQGEANLTFDGTTLFVKNAIKIEESSGSEYYQLVTNSYGGLEIQNETTKIAEFTDSSTLELQDNLKFGVAGKGIDFSIATPSGPSVDSSILADYELGTFTPTIQGSSSTGTISYVSQVGTYTKIGNLVSIEITISVDGIGTSSGSLKLAGLPFACKSSTESVTACQYNSIGSGLPSGAEGPVMAFIQAGNTSINTFRCNDSGTSSYQSLAIQTLTYFRFSLVYTAA